MPNSKGSHLSTQRRRLQDEEGGLPTIRKTHTPSIHQVTVADVTCKSSSHQCGAESSHRMHSHIGRLSTESHVKYLIRTHGWHTKKPSCQHHSQQRLDEICIDDMHIMQINARDKEIPAAHKKKRAGYLTHSKSVYNLAQRRLTTHGTVVAKAMKLIRDVAIITLIERPP